MTFIEKDVLAK